MLCYTFFEKGKRATRKIVRRDYIKNWLHCAKKFHWEGLTRLQLFHRKRIQKLTNRILVMSDNLLIKFSLRIVKGLITLNSSDTIHNFGAYQKIKSMMKFVDILFIADKLRLSRAQAGCGQLCSIVGPVRRLLSVTRILEKQIFRHIILRYLIILPIFL